MKNKINKGEGGLNTIIGKDSIIEGTVEIQGGLRVDGIVRGRISATESLAVGDSGRIEADLVVKVAVIGGKVMGNIFAQDKIEPNGVIIPFGTATSSTSLIQ